VRQMAQLHRLDDAVQNHGGTQPRSQAQEEHLAALVTPQRLHGRIIDDLDRAPECRSIVEPDPTPGEVMRFCNRPAMQDRPRPAPGQPIDTASYFQSPASSLTPRTICSAVSAGPEGNSRRSSCPLARIFTCVPPTSTTSTFMVYPSGVLSHLPRPPEQTLTGLRQGGALGSDHRH